MQDFFVFVKLKMAFMPITSFRRTVDAAVLQRLDPVETPPALPPVDLGIVRIETLSLMKSRLQPGGAVYSCLARFPLGCGE